jgi:hypothetical protein
MNKYFFQGNPVEGLPSKSHYHLASAYKCKIIALSCTTIVLPSSLPLEYYQKQQANFGEAVASH